MRTLNKNWIRQDKLSVQEAARVALVVSRNAHVALTSMLSSLTQEQVDYCAKRAPAIALEFAQEKLSDDVFNFCVKKAPVHAFRHAIKRLTQAQYNMCYAAVGKVRCIPHYRDGLLFEEEQTKRKQEKKFKVNLRIRPTNANRKFKKRSNR